MVPQHVTILNASSTPGDRADEISEVLHRLFVDQGAQIAAYRVADREVAPCLGCFGCWVRTPGICVIDDDAREIARTVVQSNLLVHVTPIVFGGVSPSLKAVLDRMIPIILPYFAKVRGEVHHVKRYRKYPNVLAIGLLDRPDLDQEEIFINLMHRVCLNMRAPASVVRVLDRPGDDPLPALRQAVSEAAR